MSVARAPDQNPFRDPPSADAAAAEMQREIAEILVRAPTLPVELPAFKLTLLGVETDGKRIDLILGKSAPISRLRLQREGESAAPTGLVTLTSKPARPRVVTATIEAIHADTSRFRAELGSMASRICASVTEPRWSAAIAVARRLRRLPAGLPLDHFRQLVPGVTRPLGLVRTGFLCNQDCGLCWQGRDWGRFDAAQVVTWIEDLHAAGARYLIISGGEPTLDPDLERYFARSRELGFTGVSLETNAVQMAKPGFTERLRKAGLTDALVSLHTGDAATSDAVTRAPGTFVRTVKGIQSLLAEGVTVTLNCVITREVLEHLASLPDFIHDTFGKHRHLESLMLSLPADPYDRALLPELIPDPVRLRALLGPTIDRALALGISVRGLDGPCGPQLCAYGADPRVTRMEPVGRDDLEFRGQIAACEGCSVRAACRGPRHVQVERYGDACVAPIKR